MFEQIVFLVFAVFALVAAIKVVTTPRISHAVLWLMSCFFGVAVLYLLLDSPFMAGIQLLIYTGGVAVLIGVASVVLRGAAREAQRRVTHSWPASIVALSLFLLMAWMTVELPLPEVPQAANPEGSLALLGAALVDPAGYLLPFELIGVLLLVLLVGALYLGKER